MRLKATIHIPDKVAPGGSKGANLTEIMEDVLGKSVVGLFDGAVVEVEVTEKAAKTETFTPEAFLPKAKKKKKKKK